MHRFTLCPGLGVGVCLGAEQSDDLPPRADHLLIAHLGDDHLVFFNAVHVIVDAVKYRYPALRPAEKDHGMVSARGGARLQQVTRGGALKDLL